jgi:hypothetical protein
MHFFVRWVLCDNFSDGAWSKKIEEVVLHGVLFFPRVGLGRPHATRNVGHLAPNGRDFQTTLRDKSSISEILGAESSETDRAFGETGSNVANFEEIAFMGHLVPVYG